MLEDSEIPLDSGEDFELIEIQPKRLARRSVKSATWNIFVNFIKLPIDLAQAIILARLLPVEYIGLFAGVAATILLTSAFFEFGLASAFLHRAPETRDEGEATATLFTLRVILSTAWAILSIGFAIYLLPGLRGQILLVMTALVYFIWISSTPKHVLIRRVQHRRIAFIDLITSFFSFVIAVPIAWYTRSIWVLVIPEVILLLANLVFLFLWKPIWIPRFAWNKVQVRYFFNFGSRAAPGNIMKVALDRVDDVWTSINLGDLLMGYYSKAYKFAIFPRMLLAAPINSVTSGTYAELKNDRRRLSEAFFRVNFLLIRSGFFIAGWLAVVAPQAITIFLGSRWLPMLDAFRLMLIFTLLDPIKLTIAHVLTVAGKPEKVSIARTAQLIVLLAGLFTLGARFEIAGVALAVDLMLVVGFVLLFYFVREFVDFSLIQLFLIPTIALITGIGLVYIVNLLFDNVRSDWVALIIKSMTFIMVYLSVLAIYEWKTLFITAREVWQLTGVRKS